MENDLRKNFLSSAIKSEQKDLHLEKQVVEKHFKKNLEKDSIFLSSLRKRANQKKTDNCKSLSF